MSDNKNNQNHTDTSLAETKVTTEDLLSKHTRVISKESVVDVATKRSGMDVLLWIVAIVTLISSTLISTYLPRYWVPASDRMTQLGITAVLVVVAFGCLALTNQGSAFKTLLKDAGVELRRVTWPSKNETFKYTWQVIVVMIVVGFIVWLLDNLFNYLLGFILQ